MRVALVYDLIYPYSKGGVERRIADVAQGLADRAHDVHVYGTKSWEAPDRITRRGVMMHGVRPPDVVHARSGRRSVRQAVTFAWSIGRSIRSENFDVIDVQATAPLACLATLLASRFSGARVMVTWHEVWGRYWLEYSGAVGVLGMAAEKIIVFLGKHHAAVSHSTARRLANLGVEDATLLPNGIDLAIIDSVPAARGTTDVVCVGRLVSHKNVELLIAAAELIGRRGLAPTISIVGDGPHRRALEELAAGMDNVSLLGMIDSDDDLVSLLKSARVFAFPSNREGFGLAALEALACGLPVVTTDHPQNATTDIVHSGHNGVVVPPDAGVGVLRAILGCPVSSACERSAEVLLEHRQCGSVRLVEHGVGLFLRGDGDRPSVDDVPGIDLLVEGEHCDRGLSQAFSAIVHIIGEHPGRAGSSAL